MENENTPVRENRQIDLPSLRECGDQSWREKAACYGRDTNDFFPESSGGFSSISVSKCRLVCYRCKVRKQCLDFAVRNHINHGVWGGMSVTDRRKISVEQVDEASRITIDVVLKHLTKARVTNRVSALAKIANVSEEMAEKMIEQPRNYYV